MTLPPISPEERNAALASALESRQARAAAKAALRSGAVTLAEVLADPESPLQGAYVRQVLRSLPRVGRAKADRAMDEAAIDPHRRVQGLGRLQREALLARFGA